MNGFGRCLRRDLCGKLLGSEIFANDSEMIFTLTSPEMIHFNNPNPEMIHFNNPNPVSCIMKCSFLDLLGKSDVVPQVSGAA